MGLFDYDTVCVCVTKKEHSIIGAPIHHDGESASVGVGTGFCLIVPMELTAVCL